MEGFDKIEYFAQAMKIMGLRRDQGEVMFRAFDADGSGDVNYQEFITEMQNIRGTEVHEMMVSVKFMLSDMRRTFEKQFEITQQLLASSNDNVQPQIQQIDIELKPSQVSILPPGPVETKSAKSAAREADEIAKLRLAQADFALTIRDLVLRTESHTQALGKLERTLAGVAAGCTRVVNPSPLHGLAVEDGSDKGPLAAGSEHTVHPTPSPALEPNSAKPRPNERHQPLSTSASLRGALGMAARPCSRAGPRLGPGPHDHGAYAAMHFAVSSPIHPPEASSARLGSTV